MISVLSMQMQQQKQKIFNGDGCRQEQDGVANCWGVCLFVVDNASAALKKIKCSIICNY